MAITVGLDFGTHQTKVCIENNDNPTNVYYEFLSFDDLDGSKCYCLPSIIQINKDHTLSYGFCNDNDCLYDDSTVDIKEPEYLKEPELKYPPKPSKPKEFDVNMAFTTGKDLLPWQMVLLSIKQRSEYKKSPEYKKWVDDNYKYELELKRWEEKCTIIKNEYLIEIERINEANDKLRISYMEKIREFESRKQMKFRYFKQAVYDYGDSNFKIDPKLLSIWYLSYIIFIVKENYGQYFSIQMGVPCDVLNHEKRRRIGTSLLLSAYYLVEDVYDNNFDNFLSAKYEDLVNVTKTIDYDESMKNDYGILIFPEACACLNRMVFNKRITPNRLHIIIDIGGGTTDISFFSISDEKPNIFKFISIPYGLNYIREKCSNENRMLDRLLIKNNYYIKVKEKIDDLIYEVKCEFKKQTNRPIELLEEVINNNMSLYVGGGTSYNLLCIDYKCFDDVKRIDYDLYPIKVTNTNINSNEYAILANAYGLAHSEIDDKVELQSIKQLFNGISIQDKNVYKIIDENNRYEYEHGLTDL